MEEKNQREDKASWGIHINYKRAVSYPKYPEWVKAGKMMVPARKKLNWPFYYCWVSWMTLCALIVSVINSALFGLLTLFVGDFIYVNGVQRITEDSLGTLLLYKGVSIQWRDNAKSYLR
jgi:hypothetical protein